MIQKIIRVGNSVAITIPNVFMKDVGLKPGNEVEVESDKELRLMIIKPKGSEVNTKITPEFKDWLGKFIKRNKKALQTLASV